MEFCGADLVSSLMVAASSAEIANGLLAGLWNILKVAIGLGLVIFVHELGHFLAAKACGVKVEKFYVGFDVPISIGPLRLPPRLFRFRRGETEYGLGMIPLGGYVRMLGQDDDPRHAEAESQRIRTGEQGELDPRSYPAKPVWQRMLIISSGVIMNLIFAVIFAACAFGWGVRYMPSMIGQVLPGNPAWNAGVRTEGKIVGVGDAVEHEEKLHFRDLRIAIMSESLENPDAPIAVTAKYADGEKTYSIVPTRRYDRKGKLASIGFSPIDSARLIGSPSVGLPNSSAAKAWEDPKYAGAQVVAINDQEIPVSEMAGEPTSLEIVRTLATNLDDPLRFTLKLAESDATEQVTLPPQAEKTFGFRWGVGPVSGVIPGSPVEQAGLKIGDQIVAFNGDNDLDAVGLWRKFHAATEPIELNVVRVDEAGNRATQTLNVKPMDISAFGFATSDPGMQLSINGDFGVARWGVAFSATNTLVGTDTDTAASAIKMEKGDIVRKLVVQWPDKRFTWSGWLRGQPWVTQPPEELFGIVVNGLLMDAYDFDEFTNAGVLTGNIQWLPLEVPVHVVYERNNKIMEGELKLQELSDKHWPERGLYFAPLESLHVASGIGEATQLGLAETGRKLLEVLGFLKMIGSGQVDADMIGGPIRIMQVAGMEAADGIPRLLLFLTLLSANLAILNFLPIPALDGGHMVFLLFEWIRGKPVDEQLQMRLTFAGVLSLLALMVFVLFNDIINIGS